MDEFRISVKSFIVNGGEELLLLKRAGDDSHRPGAWEIPGGRLEIAEDPFKGLKRETREETGLEIQIKNPLGVHHFERQDGQMITMIVFYCCPLSNSLKLSDEHTDYVWKQVKEARDLIHPKFHKELDNFLNLLKS